jgi:hypothetical protein
MRIRSVHTTVDSDLQRRLTVSEAPDSAFLIGWISSFKSPLNFSLEPRSISSCGRQDPWQPNAPGASFHQGCSFWRLGIVPILARHSAISAESVPLR